MGLFSLVELNVGGGAQAPVGLRDSDMFTAEVGENKG